ncbi:DUF6675 family protein [Treponema sp.]|uniref:DUF6675 family protein n=1 Tax=Treponema sp. TaxID=166 RepID=UPI003F0945C9
MKSCFYRLSVFFLGLFLPISFLSAYSAEEILGSENFEILKSQGKIQVNIFKPEKAEFQLLPETMLAGKIAEELNSSADEEIPSLIGENVYLIPKGNIGLDKASEILRSVSKMQGMQYYSNGEKKWTTLYHDAYCIAGPQDRTRVDDKTDGSADGLVQYCLLNDNSLGKSNYEVSYFQTENEISMKLVNTTPVYYKFLKAVKPGNIHINLVMTICDDYIVVYMNVKASFFSLGVVEKRMKKSLLNRLDAIFTWFSGQIAE